MKINLLSFLLIASLLGFVLYLNSSHDDALTDIKNKHSQTMKRNKELDRIKDSLSNVLSEIKIMSKKEIEQKDLEFSAYKDSVESVISRVNNRISKLNNYQLANEFKRAVSTRKGVDVVQKDKDTVFMVQPYNIKEAVIRIDNGESYKNLYYECDTAYDSVYLNMLRLSEYKEISDSIIKIQGRKLNNDSLLIDAYQIKIEKIDKEHAKEIKAAKIKSFGFGVGTGAVALGVLLILL